MATPTFGTIGNEKYPIDNFVVKGSHNTMTVIQVLDEEGQIDGTYYWYNAEGSYPAGWFDFNGLEPAGVELKPGEAVFFHTTEANAVTTEAAGEVLPEKTVSFVGYKMVGNCSPVTIDIDKVTVQGSHNTMTVIQTLDAEGQIEGTYYWYNAEGSYPAGWFDFNGLEPAGIQLKPGDAVFFHTTEASPVTVTIPGALAE